MRTRTNIKIFIALVYLLVLVTQFPHVWQAYRDIERAGEIFQFTSAGAALGFELSLAVFTYRLVTGSTRQWTRRGVSFFIMLSVAANLAYYNVLGGFMHNITPYLFALALPAALALYAEEFGAEVRRDERNAQRNAQRNATATDAQPETQPEAQPATQPQPVAQPETQRGATVAQHRSKHDATLLPLLQRNPDATPTQLANATNINKGTVSRWLQQNREAALHEGNGKVAAPEVNDVQ